MAVKAAQAEAKKIYRLTRDAGRTYYVLHPQPTVELIKRYERKKNPWCKDLSFLAYMKMHPDWPIFWRYERGVDFITGERWEHRFITLLEPKTKLREVKGKPGYR